MSLLTYEDARPWTESIREELIAERMPPWHVDPVGSAPVALPRSGGARPPGKSTPSSCGRPAVRRRAIRQRVRRSGVGGQRVACRGADATTTTAGACHSAGRLSGRHARVRARHRHRRHALAERRRFASRHAVDGSRRGHRHRRRSGTRGLDTGRLADDAAGRRGRPP